MKKPWRQRAATYADANGDGTIDLEDLGAISANWEKTHPYPKPVFTPGDFDSLAGRNPDSDAFQELYETLTDEGTESQVRIREILETILTAAQTRDRFSLSQNYPNPFNLISEIEYFLPNDCHVMLAINNALGQKVRVLVDDYQVAEFRSVNWDGKDDRGREVTSGVYFSRIEADEFAECRKMIILK